MAELLRVENLTKNFKELTAVNDLSFTVNEGDVYGFLGQNGAGKSTTIRMILTLVKPSHGSIFFEGKEIHHTGKKWLQNVGAIIERPDVYKFLSAYDNLSIFARLSGRKQSRKELMGRLDMVGLADRAKSKAATYSQGMKQRLGIAIALVNDPKLVILDEPTNGLDPQGIADMRELIIDLSKVHGKTVIISSHLLYEIEQVANRMIIINKGKKITEGVVSELLNPADTVVELHTNDNEKTFTFIRSSTWKDNLAPEQGQVKLKMHKENIPQLIRDVSAAGIDILSVVPRHSLEEFFLNITKEAN